tara:strand:+ start:1070 stop:1606 length:537 start_codon:yes stop_codon:yes gene_type:complete
MKDWRFARSVVYIWKHDVSGAGGVIVNKKVSAPNFTNVCTEGKIKRLPNINPPLFYGGPVMTNLVGCLHSLDYRIGTTHVTNDKIGFTLDKTVIEDIARGKGPRKYLLTMGISSWHAGQLEEELESLPPRTKSGSWLHLDYSDDIVFGPKLDTLWQDCVMQCVSNTTKSLTDKVFKNN